MSAVRPGAVRRVRWPLRCRSPPLRRRPIAYEPGYWPGRYPRDADTEAYDKLDENPFRKVSADPLSTFSIDVDTASYANVAAS